MLKGVFHPYVTFIKILRLKYDTRPCKYASFKFWSL